MEHYLWSLTEKEEQIQRKLQENKDMIEKQRQELQTQILELEKKSQDSIQNLMEVRVGTWRVKSDHLMLAEV